MATSYFKIQRGIGQGCPLSAYLFILAVEILAQKIRSDKCIKGIKIDGTEIKISQLADDTNCFLLDVESLQCCLNTFYKFAKCSGLKMNLNKTNAKYIGCLKDNDYFPHGLSWIKNKIDTLGIKCACNEEDSFKLNFKPRLLTLENTLRMWRQRKLSLKGKITVINSLALSPLIYVASVINTPEHVFHEVDVIILNFIWDGKRAKIARKTLELPVENGGMKLCNFRVKVHALQLSWVNRLISSTTEHWAQIPKFYFKTDNLKTFFTTKQKDISKISKVPLFYKDIHNIWMKIYSVTPNSIKDVQREKIWNNKYITAEGLSG